MTWLERDDAKARSCRAEWTVRAAMRARDAAQRNEIDEVFHLRVVRARLQFALDAIRHPVMSRESLELARRDAEEQIAAEPLAQHWTGIAIAAADDTTGAAGVLASLDWFPPHVGYRPRTTREKR